MSLKVGWFWDFAFLTSYENLPLFGSWFLMTLVRERLEAWSTNLHFTCVRILNLQRFNVFISEKIGNSTEIGVKQWCIPAMMVTNIRSEGQRDKTTENMHAINTAILVHTLVPHMIFQALLEVTPGFHRVWSKCNPLCPSKTTQDKIYHSPHDRH